MVFNLFYDTAASSAIKPFDIYTEYYGAEKSEQQLRFFHAGQFGEADFLLDEWM